MDFTYGIKLHVWGEYACFTRPELKSERMSYELMTPSAARGILSAIYWKPEFAWVIDKIHVLNPIRFSQIRRNELGSKIPAPSKAVMEGKPAVLGSYIESDRQQRAATLLRDVSYIIEAHVEIISPLEGVDCVAKHLECFKRRARLGQCFKCPCLGAREFMAMFSLLESEKDVPPSCLPEEERNQKLGLMLHDMVYRDCDKKHKESIMLVDHQRSTKDKRFYKYVFATPHFFMAELHDGVMTIPPLKNTHS